MKITKGRITGGQFLLLSLPTVLLGVIDRFGNQIGSPWDGIVFLLFLLSIPVMVAAAIPRSHDLGRSGWFGLITLIPFVGWYLVLKRGQPGPNEYGPPPRGTKQDDTGEMTEREKEREVQRLLREGTVAPKNLIRDGEVVPRNL